MDNKELAQTQEEIRQAIRTLTIIVWKMGHYIHQNTKNGDLKAHLKELGGEIRRIKTPRKR